MAEKITLATLKNWKNQGRPFAMLTCYDYSTAELIQQAGMDGIIVGDSLAQLVLGHQTTLPATMDIMVELTRAVRKGAPDVYLVGDMPFLSYQVGTKKAICNAGRFLVEACCDAVKVEVDRNHLDLVAELSAAGIPVMAHLGYRPQAAQQQDRIVQTRSFCRAQQVFRDALDMAKAGATTILLECVTSVVAQAITERVDVPVVSCGSGPECDGQVLVLHDVVGLCRAKGPRFSKRYTDLSGPLVEAVNSYAQEVHDKSFPDPEHSYHMDQQQQQEFQHWLSSYDPQESQNHK